MFLQVATAGKLLQQWSKENDRSVRYTTIYIILSQMKYQLMWQTIYCLFL